MDHVRRVLEPVTDGGEETLVEHVVWRLEVPAERPGRALVCGQEQAGLAAEVTEDGSLRHAGGRGNRFDPGPFVSVPREMLHGDGNDLVLPGALPLAGPHGRLLANPHRGASRCLTRSHLSAVA